MTNKPRCLAPLANERLCARPQGHQSQHRSKFKAPEPEQPEPSGMIEEVLGQDNPEDEAPKFCRVTIPLRPHRWEAEDIVQRMAEGRFTWPRRPWRGY